MVSEPTGTPPSHGWTSDQAWDLVHAAATTASDLAQIATQHPHLRPYIAAHPHADSELLTWLAMQNDPVITAALATRTTPTLGAPPTPVPAPPAPSAPGPVPVQPTGAVVGASTAMQAPPPPPPADTTVAAPRARHRTRLIAWVVVAVLVVAGGLTATKLLLNRRAAAADTPGQEFRLADMRTKPHTGWTWQPTNPPSGASVSDVTEIDPNTTAIIWAAPATTTTTAHLVVLDSATGKTRWQQDVPACPSTTSGPFLASGDGIIGYFNVKCPQSTTTVGLYDATNGQALAAGTLPGEIWRLVLTDRTLIGATTNDGTHWQLAAWSVDHLNAPLWERPLPDQAGPYTCILGPHQVGVVAKISLQNGDPSTCGDAYLGDIADLTAQGANPYPTTNSDTVYELVTGGYLLTVAWSTGDWALLSPTGQTLRFGRGGPGSARYTMGVAGGTLIRWDQQTSTIVAVDPATGDDQWTKGIDDSAVELGGSTQALAFADLGNTAVTWYKPTSGQRLAHMSVVTTMACRVMPGQQLSYLVGPCSPNAAQLAAVDLTTGQQLWTLSPAANTSIWALTHHLYEVSNSGSAPSVALLTDTTH